MRCVLPYFPNERAKARLPSVTQLKAMGLGFDLAAVLVARGPVHEGLDGPDLPPGVHIVFSVSQSGKFYTSGSVPLCLSALVSLHLFLKLPSP